MGGGNARIGDTGVRFRESREVGLRERREVGLRERREVGFREARGGV